MQNNRPLVLVVAGLDSGGGAGITADCLTVHDNLAYALPCVSALTCQSLKEITRVVATDEQTFEESLHLAAKDWKSIGAIKVGLISDNRLLLTLFKYLDNEFKDVPVVWDPVLCGTAGDLHSVNLKEYLKEILTRTTIFTPNLPEALALSGWTQEKLDTDGIEALAKFFIDNGAKNIIIKGGHNFEGFDAVDYYASDDLSFNMACSRVEGEGAHGGGCALSSALAALLANDFAPQDAAVLSKGYVYSGIVYPALCETGDRPPLGHNGLVQSLEYLPAVIEKGFPTDSQPFPPCPLKLGLYPVVDSYEWIERLVNLGVKTIQLRIKDKNRSDLFEQIEKSVAFCAPKGVRLFIDDHYELAIKAHAYGVHLGMEDLRDADLDLIRNAGLRLGVSTHGAYEMLKAMQLNPSYIALGHIYPTNSKQMPSKPQGPMKLMIEQSLIGRFMPTVAIGGIKLHNVNDVLQTGVGSVALITGITKADDPDETTRLWLRLCGSGDE